MNNVISENLLQGAPRYRAAHNEWSARERTNLSALALIGAAFVLFQAWGYIAWLVDDIPLRRAAFDVPAEIAAAVRGAERLIGGGAVVWLVVLIVVSLRARRLTWPVLLSVAWVLVYWQESLVNAREHAFSYNAYFLHREDWMSHLPLLGFSKPLLNQPLLMEAPVFFWLIPVVGIGTAAFLTLLSRWIRSLPLLVLLGVAFGSSFETGFEFSGISQQLLAWNHVPAALSVNTATPTQWPMLEALLGMVWSLPGVLWFLRDRALLRWLDPAIGPRGAQPAAIRILALTAVINLVFLAYNLLLILPPATATAVFPPWVAG